MPVEPGQTLLHYRIAEKLGEGGMGVVWRATDTTLDREVAIKILPDTLAQEPERLVRFEREAKSLAALNHPNIAAIHSVHEAPPEQGSLRFLAMELVAGEDLSERMERGPIPIDEALEIAGQIATGLDAAHVAGLVHRDLKPANVKLTADKKVKVLDFGLAKVWGGDGASAQSDPSLSPTMTSAGTMAGMILGTAAYMSPEQARGYAVDQRTDVWALGVILYEMLTGRRLFEGQTVSDILAGVLKTEPDFSRLPAATPPAARRLLRRCLQRDPQQRLHHMGDVRLELEDALRDPNPALGSSGGEPTAPANRPSLAGLLAICAVTLAAGVLIGHVVFDSRGSSGEPGGVTRFTVPMPQGRALGWTDLGSPMALSPDGRTLVFQADLIVESGSNLAGGLEAGTAQLFRRDLDTFESIPIPGTDGATVPFFSPDGAWIGFWAGGELRKTRLGSGSPITIARDITTISGAHWDDDGTIYFGGGLGSGILSVPSGGGDVVPVTELDTAAGEIIHGNPRTLPDGSILFTASAGESRLFVTSGSSPNGRREVFRGGSAIPLPGGGLLLSERDAVRATGFDLASATLTGEPVPLFDGLDYDALGGLQMPSIAVSESGTIAYGVRRAPPVTTFHWIRFGGKTEVRQIQPSGDHFHVRLSPDGTHMVTSKGQDGIWITDVATGAAQPAWQQGAAYQARWSADGESLVFKLNGDLVVLPVTGAAEPEVLLDREGYLTPYSWSADGDLALVEGIGRGSDIVIRAGSGEVRKFRETEAIETNPEISPDGRWLAFVSDVAGTFDVYVAAFDGSGGSCAVTRGGGFTPAWSPDGRRLYYAREGLLWVTEFKGDSCRTENPRIIVDSIDVPADLHQRNWDLLPDESGIVLVDRSDMFVTKALEIHVVVDGVREVEAALESSSGR